MEYHILGIILCELIGRTGADPDVLPRTSNFGVDYIAFSAICPDCPPDFIQLSFDCVRVSKIGKVKFRKATFIGVFCFLLFTLLCCFYCRSTQVADHLLTSL